MSNAAIYIRVSTVKQATEGVSLDAQEEAARAYCAMRGLTVAALVVDAGVSGGTPLVDREGGRELQRLVAAGEVTAIVTYKLDRLFRSASDCLGMTRAWEAHGAALHFVDMGGQAIDTSSAMGRFFLTVMAGVAELERDIIRERTGAAMAHKRSRGEKTGGSVPYGYMLAEDGRTLAECEAEQEVITACRELRADGVSLRRIAEELSRRGFKPRSGKRWYAVSVTRILAPDARRPTRRKGAIEARKAKLVVQRRMAS